MDSLATSKLGLIVNLLASCISDVTECLLSSLCHPQVKAALFGQTFASSTVQMTRISLHVLMLALSVITSSSPHLPLTFYPFCFLLFSSLSTQQCFLPQSPLMFKDQMQQDVIMVLKFPSNSPVTHVAANTLPHLTIPAVVTVTCSRLFAVNRWHNTVGMWSYARHSLNS